MLFRLTSFLLFLLTNTISFAQTNSLAISYGIGYTIPNHPAFPEIKSPSNSMELSWTHKSNAFWSTLNGGASFNLNAAFQNFGNNAVLGYALALTPSMSLPVLKKRQFSMQLQLGWGAAWITKKFDSFSNPGNIVIGTNLNASVSAGLEFAYKIKSLEPFLGLRVQHYSNGNAMSPNLGINLPILQTGLRLLIERKIKAYDLMRWENKMKDSTFVKYEFPKLKIPFRPFLQLGLGISANIQRGPFFPVTISILVHNGYTAHRKRCGPELNTVSIVLFMNFIKTTAALLTLENLTAMQSGLDMNGFSAEWVSSLWEDFISIGTPISAVSFPHRLA